jgi:hypothetical protein
MVCKYRFHEFYATYFFKVGYEDGDATIDEWWDTLFDTLEISHDGHGNFTLDGQYTWSDICILSGFVSINDKMKDKDDWKMSDFICDMKNHINECPECKEAYEIFVAFTFYDEILTSIPLYVSAGLDTLKDSESPDFFGLYTQFDLKSIYNLLFIGSGFQYL